MKQIIFFMKMFNFILQNTWYNNFQHVNANHAIIIKTFEEEVNSPLKKTVQKQLTKKRPNLFGGQISKNSLQNILE